MTFFVQTLAKRGRIDDVRHWADSDIIRRPVFNVQEFQKKIDKAIGLSKDGLSIVRLRWAWDLDCFSEYYTEWNAEGFPTKSELRARYVFRVIELENGEKFEVCPPRWVLEELNTPERIVDAWEKTRWQVDPVSKKRVPQKPPAPRTGYYSFYKYIANHDKGKGCCARALAADQECFGVYRQPLDLDVREIKKAWFSIRHNEKRVNPYAPLDEKDLALIQQNTENADREAEERREIEAEERRRFYEDVMKPSAEYSLPNAPQPSETRTESGLILLN